MSKNILGKRKVFSIEEKQQLENKLIDKEAEYIRLKLEFVRLQDKYKNLTTRKFVRFYLKLLALLGKPLDK